MSQFQNTMPIPCPEGFDSHVWGKVKDKEPNNDFTLALANELMKQNFSILEVCDCLDVESTRTEQDVSGIAYCNYVDVLQKWKIAVGSERGLVGKLITCLVKKLGVQCEPLCSICQESLKDEGEVIRFSIQSYSNGGDGFPDATSEDHDDAAIYSELVSGRFSLITKRQGLSDSNNVVTPEERRMQLEVDEKYHRLSQRIEEVQKNFASLITHAYSCIKQVDIDRLRVYLSQRCADKSREIPFFEERIIEMLLQSSHHQVFVLMSQIRAWDFLDYSLLEDVLNEFSVRDADAQIALYAQKVRVFQSETKLTDFLHIWKSCCPQKVLGACETLIAKCDSEMVDMTLADVATKAKLLASRFNLITLESRFGWGHPGSAYLLWYIPKGVARHIEKIMESKERPNLVCYGIQQLVVGRNIYKDCGSHNFTDDYQASIEDPEYFFGKEGRTRLQWIKPFKRANNCRNDGKSTKIEWFAEGKLNVSVNCLDRHDGSKTAIYWEPPNQEPEQITYRQLLQNTCKVANILKSHGINKGDRVIIYMPAMPLAIASMLACARMGAVHCVVFSDYDLESLKERIIGTKARCIITANERVKTADVTNPLKSIVDEAMKDSKVKNFIKHVFVAKRTDRPTDKFAHDVNLDEEMNTASPEFPPEAMDSEDELLITYTSGTGKKFPRGIVHSQAGFLLNVTLGHKFMFDGQPGDIVGCTADLGWMAGHTCVYGPLCNGEATVLFEGLPWDPDPGRYWEIVQRLKLTNFYTIPCVLQKLKSSGDKYVEKYDLSSLKMLIVAGEPLQPDVEEWYFKVVGREQCLLIDAWGQTEIAAIGLLRWRAPKGIHPVRFPRSSSFALFGVDYFIKPGEGTQPGEVRGALYFKKPLPSMGRKVIDHSKDGPLSESNFSDYYFNKETGFYETFDMVNRVPSGDIQVIGRVDDSIRIKGVDWMSNEISSRVSENLNEDTKSKIQLVLFIKPEKKALCAMLQLKQNTLGNDSKREIIQDIEDIFQKLYVLSPDDQVPLTFVFIDGVIVTPSGKRSLYQMQRASQFTENDSGLPFKTVSVKCIAQARVF